MDLAASPRRFYAMEPTTVTTKLMKQTALRSPYSSSLLYEIVTAQSSTVEMVNAFGQLSGVMAS